VVSLLFSIVLSFPLLRRSRYFPTTDLSSFFFGSHAHPVVGIPCCHSLLMNSDVFQSAAAHHVFFPAYFDMGPSCPPVILSFWRRRNRPSAVAEISVDCFRACLAVNTCGGIPRGPGQVSRRSAKATSLCHRKTRLFI